MGRRVVWLSRMRLVHGSRGILRNSSLIPPKDNRFCGWQSLIGSPVVRLSRTRPVYVKLTRTAAIAASAGPGSCYHRFEETPAQFFELDIHLPPSKIGLGAREWRKRHSFHHGMFRIRYPRDCQPHTNPLLS